MIMNQIRTICIATVTRQRPVMLRALLESYAGLAVPAQTALRFVIIENSDTPTLHDTIDEYRATLPGTLDYIVEPGSGIAIVRNRAIQYAADRNFDLLAFADDDETVDTNWLIALLAALDLHDLAIVGSHVRTTMPAVPLTAWQKLLFQGFDQINRNAEARLRALWRSGNAASIKLGTGSWMARITVLNDLKLRFDETLGASGGEDWLLWEQAKSLGARTGWTPHALISETIPASRLSLAYCYRRNRDHARQVFAHRLAKSRSPHKILLSLTGRMVKIAAGVLTIPVRGHHALIAVAANIGSLVGFCDVWRGRRSSHYATTTGN
jgi:glycosyltransferase involved in cell wall biosynthesis